MHFLRNDKEIPMEKIREVFSEEEKAKEVFKRKLRAKRRKEKAEDSNKLMPSTCFIYLIFILLICAFSRIQLMAFVSFSRSS